MVGAAHMTGWYAYRWECEKCKAVHYYDPSESGCGRCQHKEARCVVNRQSLVDRAAAMGITPLVLPSQPQPVAEEPVAEPPKPPAKAVKPKKVAQPEIDIDAFLDEL